MLKQTRELLVPSLYSLWYDAVLDFCDEDFLCLNVYLT